MYQDRFRHFATSCERSKKVIEDFWEKVTNNFSIEWQVALFALDEEEFCNAILGKPLPWKPSREDSQLFFALCVDFVNNVLS